MLLLPILLFTIFPQHFLISRMVVLNINWRPRCLSHLFHLLLTSDLNCHEYSSNFSFDFFQHGGEQIKSLALIFLLRIFLRITTQMDALAQMI